MECRYKDGLELYFQQPNGREKKISFVSFFTIWLKSLSDFDGRERKKIFFLDFDLRFLIIFRSGRKVKIYMATQKVLQTMHCRMCHSMSLLTQRKKYISHCINRVSEVNTHISLWKKKMTNLLLEFRSINLF